MHSALTEIEIELCLIAFPFSLCRHRKHEDDSMTAGARCCFGLLILIAQILLNGVMALCLYWVIQYRSNAEGKTFAWKDDPDLEFNLHPVLMIAGFIYFMGQGERRHFDPSLVNQITFSST